MNFISMMNMKLGLRSFFFYELSIGKRISSVDPEDCFPEERILVTLDVGKKGDPYGTSLQEMLLLLMLATQNDTRNIFEFGTFLGQTAYNLSLNIPGRIYTLALPSEQMVRKVWENQPQKAQITALHGDSSTFDFEPFVGQMELVFVDGDHSYQGCRIDTQNALKMVRKGGLVVWHDYAPCWPGVVRTLNDLSKEILLLHLRHTSLVIHRRK